MWVTWACGLSQLDGNPKSPVIVGGQSAHLQSIQLPSTPPASLMPGGERAGHRGPAAPVPRGRGLRTPARSRLVEGALGLPFPRSASLARGEEASVLLAGGPRAGAALRLASRADSDLLSCPAAGTVSVGTSSCLSLSQHPSPTSVFRHHYIPYFRGKARSAAGCGRPGAFATRVCRVRVAAWLPEPRVPCLCSSRCLVSPASFLFMCECSWEQSVGASWCEG